jgi:hypothetical protein
MLTQVVEEEVELTTGSPSGWYVLYAPGGSSSKLIYHRSNSSRYVGWSTSKSPNCHDPQTHLVGKCQVYFGCVEDLSNAFGSGENNLGAGYGNLNNLSGRFKDPVPDLYKQREAYAFLKYDGYFKDETDIQGAQLGWIMIRYVPTGKLVPSRIFGQPLEASWKDLGNAEEIHPLITRPSVTSYSDTLLSPTVREIAVVWSPVVGSEILLDFDNIVLGKVRVLEPELSVVMNGKTIRVICKALGSSTATIQLSGSSLSLNTLTGVTG